MAELLVFGLGFSASTYVARYGGQFAKITATRRQPGQEGALDILPFDGANPDAHSLDVLRQALATATHLLVSAPPDQAGDPVLAHLGPAIASAPQLRTIVYFSTIGVYGDHDGNVIDEDAELRPGSPRNRQRIAVEEQWMALGRTAGKAVHVLRLSGIYGPGRNQLVKVRQGNAQRVIREGQVFNRIHTADIAQATEAAFNRANVEQRAWNITDSEPCAPQLPITYAAELLGVAPPPEIPFAEANFSPMALSFWGENKRVSNRRMREELGVTLMYPSYREGLAALAAAGDGR